MTDKNYKLVLGLEIHIQPKTQTKMFCGCSADIWQAKPNTLTCPTCLGLPGALPVPNLEAIKKTQLLGIALNCRINKSSKFDRKHYFYPDLPKGFQISQYKNPFCINGHMDLDNKDVIKIERVHLEEDTAKSFHKGGKTLIDFNKSGMPLIEIVTEPSFKNTRDAIEFCKTLQDIARTAGISDADMEKGQFRIEPNISLRSAEMERNEKLPDYKVEIKNINSFKFMERAVEAEIKRQTKLLDGGEKVEQENRGYNESTGKTLSQRVKEEAHDYRYFPEPDIPPMEFDEDYTKELSELLPELPFQTKERLISQYNLSEQNAGRLSSGAGLELLGKFEEFSTLDIAPEKVANILLNRKETRSLDKKSFLKKIEMESNIISDEIELNELVMQVIEENKQAVDDYKSGKESAGQFLLGQVMRKSDGKVDPNNAMELLKSGLI
jgi:aspartyl-tRNA(Asn)/glutamyl-tRNA(Gln) amidotransferase subunit B